MLAGLAMLLVCVAGGSVSGDREGRDLDGVVAEATRAFEVPGVGLAVVKDEHVVAARGYGQRRLGTDGPVNGRTTFGIASLTKAFTAVSLALVDALLVCGNVRRCLVRRHPGGRRSQGACHPGPQGAVARGRLGTLAARYLCRPMAGCRAPRRRFVTFVLGPEGRVEQVKMKPVSPATDYSFDFQDLILKPWQPSRGSRR